MFIKVLNINESFVTTVPDRINIRSLSLYVTTNDGFFSRETFTATEKKRVVLPGDHRHGHTTSLQVLFVPF